MKGLLLLWGLLAGPVFGFEEAVVFLSGASCVEELSEEVLSRWEGLAAHPVDLNVAGRSRLLASGLLTPFQVASLMEYRARTGAVLSWAELALVDGFSEEIVAAVRVFARLGTGPDAGGTVGRFVPGRRESLRLAGSVTARGVVREEFDSGGEVLVGGVSGVWTGAGGVKMEAAAGERFEAFVSARNTLSDSRFSLPTFSFAYYGRRALGQLVLGHFQARFGQGLVLWSGFSLSGYSSVGAFRRNGNGFAPTGSYSPSMLGVASDWHFGRWRLSAGYSLGSSWEDVRAWGGGLPVVNLTRFCSTATLGLTATSKAAGLEARWSLPGGWGLFGEAASTWQGEFSAVAGAVRVPAYGHKWAMLARWFGPASKQFSGLAVGYAGPALEATLDAGVKGLGARADSPAASGAGDGSLALSPSGFGEDWPAAFPSASDFVDGSLADFLAGGGQLQIKSVAQWKPVFALANGRLQRVSSAAADTVSGALLFRPQLRLVARWRPEESPGLQAAASSSSSLPSLSGLRLELRGALAAEWGPWTLGGRYDAVWYRGFAWNWYAEAGYRTESLKVWVRGGLFKVDAWDDRIYVYERDAPGSFTVPARYGRGWNASLYAAWQPRRPLWPGLTSRSHRRNLTSGPLRPSQTARHLRPGQTAGGEAPAPRPGPVRHSFWLRVETVQYPWNLSPKPGRLEIRLQYRYKW